MRGTRAVQYGLLGCALAIGGPLGWLAIRVASGAVTHGIVAELHRGASLYLYLLLGCLCSYGVFGAWLGMLADRLAAADARHLRDSITDALTGLFNARHFHTRLAEELSRADRGKAPLSLVMIDLDLFKRVNDRWGHHAGDLVLMRVGALLKDLCRTSDLACRVGGEEVAILCPDTPMETARVFAERLRAGIESLAIAWQGERIAITASFGVAEWSRAERAESLYERADSALYAAKARGRNRVEHTALASQVSG